VIDLGEQIVGVWRVTGVDGVAVEADAADPGPNVTFAADGSVTGSTGVNRIRGSYRLMEGTVHVGPLATTRMAGPPAAMGLETRLLAVLAEPLSARRTAACLMLSSAAGGLTLEPAGQRP